MVGLERQQSPHAYMGAVESLDINKQNALFFFANIVWEYSSRCRDVTDMYTKYGNLSRIWKSLSPSSVYCHLECTKLQGVHMKNRPSRRLLGKRLCTSQDAI